MIFQSGKYCHIWISTEHTENHEDKEVAVTFPCLVCIRDTGDTHLDIACTDLSHALELWTAIERSPEVKIVVNVNDYIHIENTLDTVKDEFADCKHRPITKEDCNPSEFDLEEMA